MVSYDCTEPRRPHTRGSARKLDWPESKPLKSAPPLTEKRQREIDMQEWLQRATPCS